MTIMSKLSTSYTCAGSVDNLKYNNDFEEQGRQYATYSARIGKIDAVGLAVAILGHR